MAEFCGEKKCKTRRFLKKFEKNKMAELLLNKEVYGNGENRILKKLKKMLYKPKMRCYNPRQVKYFLTEIYFKL